MLESRSRESTQAQHDKAPVLDVAADASLRRGVATLALLRTASVLDVVADASLRRGGRLRPFGQSPTRRGCPHPYLAGYVAIAHSLNLSSKFSGLSL